LKWRVSNKKSAKKSLGWIPFKKVAVKYTDGYIQYGKHQFKLWDSYGIGSYKVKSVHLLKIVVGIGMSA
jgi:hypothetical protein